MSDARSGTSARVGQRMRDAGLPADTLAARRAALPVAVQEFWRALAAARCRPVPRSRAGFVLRQVAPSLLAGAVAVVVVQLVVLPWLAAPPIPAGPALS